MIQTMLQKSMQEVPAEALKKPKRLSNSQQRTINRRQLQTQQRMYQLMQEQKLRQIFQVNPLVLAIKKINQQLHANQAAKNLTAVAAN